MQGASGAEEGGGECFGVQFSEEGDEEDSAAAAGGAGGVDGDKDKTCLELEKRLRHVSPFGKLSHANN